MYRYKIYLTAALLAVLMTTFIAPEIHQGKAMSPLLKDGDVVLLLKQSYSENRGMPEKGELIVLEKGAFGEEYEEDNPIRTVAGLPGDKVEMEDGSFVLIEKNQLFVASANPEKGIDSSKKNVGLIDSKEIRGKVIVRLWPLDSLGGF